MTPERWRQITDVFDRAVALARPERDAFVRGACTTDSALRAEVESMLAAHESAGTFGERPVGTLTITAPRLAAGTAIGCYCIETLIGAGGMGEVYRAHDTRLNRDVAIKVLPSSFTDDRERMTRFEREARLLAALSHPRIGAIHGLEESDNVRALVLELIEGETLSDRLHRGPLPPAQAVEFAIQIAEALDHAHRRGVTHRDLKPSNIMLTAAGVKIFDFGLGQWTRPLIASAGRLVPTDGAGLTTRGTILGTFHYMAPEQVESKPVDARTDLFAFGVVLYEMLAGRKAFDGDTPVGIAAAILHTQPTPLAIVQPATPPALEHIVSTCLAKDPDQRWQSAGDVARQLQWIRAAQGDAAVVGKSSGSSFGGRWRTAAAVAAALFSATVLLAVMWTWNRPSSKSPQQISVTRSTLPMPGRAVFDGDLALSPDGTHLAYVISHGVDGLRLYVQALDEFEPKLIAGAETPQSPFFSPDSQWLGFSDSGKLKKVAVSGGAPQTICDTPAIGGAAWAPDDTIVFSPHPRSGLFRVPAGGGMPQVVTSLRPGEKSHRLPQFLPGGKSVLFTIVPSNIRSFDEAQIAIASVDSGQIKVLRERGTNPRFVPTGHLLYLRGLSLITAPFDPRREEVIGRSVAVLDGVSSLLDGGSVLAAVDDHGLLAYLRGTVFGSDNRLVWVDRQGRIEPLIDTLGAYSGVGLSPDGQTLAIDIMAANDQIWLYDLARRTMTELTYDWDNGFPIWTPDGKRVAFESDRAGPFNFYWQNRDGSGSIERLTVSPTRQGGGSWLPDGKGFAYVDSSPGTDWDIWLLSLASGRPPRPLIQAPFNQWFATFSPDGRWLAYVSDETGQSEVFVQPYPSLDAKWHISSGGGTHPKWGKHELYYRTGRNGQQFMAVPFRTEPTFVPESPQLLFSGEFAESYDVAPDGRFIMIQVAPDVRPAREITLVHNWFAELKRRELTK